MELRHYLEIVNDADSGWSLSSVKKDLANLVTIADNSGDYDIQLRRDYFDIYYHGYRLATVELEKNGTYTAKIHWKFLTGQLRSLTTEHDHSSEEPGRSRKDEQRKQLKTAMGIQPHSSQGKGDKRHEVFRQIQRRDSSEKRGYLLFHQFFQKMTLEMIASNIRRKGGREEEERMFEQALIADNPPTKDFIIIDRQVSIEESEEAEAKKSLKKMDVLALKRDHKGEYHFVVIEVKLGNNPELAVDPKNEAKVVKQLTEYVETVREKIDEFAHCYEENYRQKVELGLLEASDSPPLENEVQIDRNPETVDGLVVVVGYSRPATERIDGLDRLLKANGLRPVCHIKNEPRLATRC